MLTHRGFFGFSCLIAVIGLAACTTKPQTQNAPPPQQSFARPAPRAAVASSILPGSVKDFQVSVGDTVHFALNKYAIEENDKTLLQRQAAWLNRYPAVHVTIEGHCDERGTREYNIALGARRASAVKDYLMSNGVSNARIDTISYGKERPVCTQSNEECWAQNRRGVTTITNGAVS